MTVTFWLMTYVFAWSGGDRWEDVYQNDQQSTNGKLIRRTR
jgi:hypothetical protein